MSGLSVTGIAFAAALVLAGIGLPIGVSMGVVGVVGLWIVTGPTLAWVNLQTLPYNTAAQYLFVVVPMFVLMGSITSVSGSTASLYTLIERSLRGVRGSLLHATTIASAGFAAISGSTVVNAALFTKVALPQMIRLGYDKAFAAGCIAAAGTLAALIPPSISFVLYGILTDEPIGELLIAGIVPGMLTAVAYIVVIGVMLKIRPGIAPPATAALPFRERFEGLGTLWPILTLALLVVGGIYSGFMTPSSAGAVGAAGALCIALVQQRLTTTGFRSSLESTVTLTSALFMIVIGGLFFSRLLLLSGAIGEMSTIINDWNINRWVFVVAVVIIYLILGIFMDATSMLVVTLPFFYPLVKHFGFDGVWFGVLVVKLVEIAVLSPPVGMNLFAVVSASEGRISVSDMFRGIWPFVWAEIVVLAILIAFPSLSLFLPQMMRS
ncbi:MAG: TRAP transporter large permease [Mesorhizobium sp.]